ncbi:hypothetical protein GF377_10265 [candidate division GN15 bacterium]|nr:hypothetical protein [candidate division GN15 bacterium]
MEFLTLPLRLTHGYFGRGDLHDSIRHSVGLILSTRLGQLQFLPEFGCAVWENEYADMLSANKSDVRAALRNSLDTYEKRLYNLSVSFSPEELRSGDSLSMSIRISGNYKDGDEERKFEEMYRLL